MISCHIFFKLQKRIVCEELYLSNNACWEVYLYSSFVFLKTLKTLRISVIKLIILVQHTYIYYYYIFISSHNNKNLDIC